RRLFLSNIFAYTTLFRSQVVVEHIRRLGGGDVQGDIHAPPVVRHQGFQLHVGRQLADFAQAVGEVLGAAVAQVVAIHRGDHHVRSEEHTSELQSRENLV